MHHDTHQLLPITTRPVRRVRGMTSSLWFFVVMIIVLFAFTKNH